MFSIFGGLLGRPFRTTIFAGKFLAFTHLFLEYGYSIAPAFGPSMLPTFDILGEWLLISRRHRYGRNVQVGDLVAYSIPINDSVGVKRLMGLPGDYVLLDAPGSGSDDMIQVIGTSERARPPAHMNAQVPQGHCWIVGDNITASRDSRSFGPVPLALISGKVIGSIKSSRFRWIKNPLRKVD